MVGNFTRPRRTGNYTRKTYGGRTRFTKRVRYKKKTRGGRRSRSGGTSRRSSRPKRRGRRGATPSSAVHGITATSSTKLAQIFRFDWLHTDENELIVPQTIHVNEMGDIIDPNPANPLLVSGKWNIMRIGAYEHFIDLVQRKGLYKEFKINQVRWQFFKDSAAHLGSSTQSACNYTDIFDHRHSKIYKNPMMNALPPEPIVYQTSEQDKKYARFLSQSPGKMLDTINGLKASVTAPARCITRRVLYAEGSDSVAAADEIPITTTTPFPWMSLERDLAKLPQVAEINTFIPMLVIRLDSNTNMPSTADITANPDPWRGFFQHQVQKFGWFYRAHVSWSCRGKHLEANLAVDPAIITID